jgi:raffinose/stachyose/melibiose transport system substrate-binding protein
MSKKVLFLLMGVLALVLVACGGTAEEPTEAPAADAPAADEPADEPAADEPADEPMEEVTLTIESWRNDDLTIWEDVIIPAFNEQHPNIEVVFAPTAPAEYDGVLNTKLEGGSAGDLITCRPFDRSLALFEQGHLAPVNDVPGMELFGDVAKSAWITDDGSTVFCVPMASVIHGFIYNQEIFDELGLEEPATVDEFFAVLDAIQADGNYTPLDMGTSDQWESATMGFQNIGPNYWMGEDGRNGLIAGTEKYSDPQYVAVWQQLADWAPYLASGYEAQTYPDSQNLFTLGQAAIYPAGSWDIGLFRDQGDFEMGAFKPPVPAAGDDCFISDHVDIALGMNAATENKEAAETFLSFIATQEFANIYSNSLPGFFSLADVEVTLDDALAQEFLDWRQECGSTIRNSYQILQRGEPNLENELWRLSALVMNGEVTPEEAAQEIQAGLENWYEPQQGG